MRRAAVQATEDARERAQAQLLKRGAALQQLAIRGVKSMAKDEARIIRASDVPLTRRPKFWPPEPFQMECPSDWRRGVVVAWSSEPSPGYCYLQLLGTDRAVTVAGHRVMFGGRNAPQRAIRPVGLWHRRRARWRTVYEMLERKEAA